MVPLYDADDLVQLTSCIMIILSTFILAHFKHKYFGIVARAELQVIQEMHQYNTNKNQTKNTVIKLYRYFTCT